MRRDRVPFRRRQEPLHSINHHIRTQIVRVVGDGIAQGVYPLAQALRMAQEKELDLVEIAPKANPPVCRIVDYKKFLYEQKKKQKEIKNKATKIVIKEIRFGPNTDEHDFNFKLNHAKKFLEEGSKVKAYVFFKGRTIVFKDRGEGLLVKLLDELKDYGSPESHAKMEGKRLIVILAPKKKK